MNRKVRTAIIVWLFYNILKDLYNKDQETRKLKKLLQVHHDSLVVIADTMTNETKDKLVEAGLMRKVDINAEFEAIAKEMDK